MNNKLIKKIAIGTLAFLVILALFSIYTSPVEETEDISLTQLVERINEGNVEKIEVEGDRLAVELKDGGIAKAIKETESSLSESLTNLGATDEAFKGVTIAPVDTTSSGIWFNIVLPFLLPFLLIGFFVWFLMKQAQKGGNQAMSFGLSRAKMMIPTKDGKKITFKDVAGAKESKEELYEVVEFLKNPKKFTKLGARIPRGFILLGPPGTGKTLLAKAVAGEANVPFFSISGSEFVEMFVGVGASRVRDLFKQAKKASPAIVFIDEIDAVGRHRGAGLGGGNDEREQTLNQILVEMDGFNTDTNVIVIASTNRPDVLDPALLRPGRFDRRIMIDVPDIREREEILKIHIEGKPLSKEIDLTQIAERTPGFSGADLANLLNEAAILTARRNKANITMQEMREAIAKVILGPERRSQIMDEEEKKVTAYHEGGHALVATILPKADPVHKVSIISRGHAAGYTLNVPKKDQRLHFKSYYLDQLAVLLGGYVTEKEIFGEVTTGASNDLERATDIARKLVTRFGMSNMGPITFGKADGSIFLGKEIQEQKNYSEQVAEQIDEEVRLLIMEAFNRSKEIIINEREKLEKIVKELLEKETIEKDRFQDLLGIEDDEDDKSILDDSKEVVEEKDHQVLNKKNSSDRKEKED
ncbi:MAG: ATP-dependent zinc metalloprotease FtsH [Patescibacteria group bacterium]|jgi:cell division protease FtsH|nr:ATP-dependent zinc metalloprotease FtsH [Patescibacteria group bacterium]